MGAFDDWPKFAIPQKRPNTGCIPAGYEFLIRAAGFTDIDYDNFQDQFDLEFRQIGKNNFSSISEEIMKSYPNISIAVKFFERGVEKLDFIEALLIKNRPVLMSLTLNEQGGWHIAPVVEIHDGKFLILWMVNNNMKKNIYELDKMELARIHDEWPGGKDISFLNIE